MGMGKKVGSGGGYYQDGGLFQDRLAAGFVSVRGLTQVSMGTMSVRSKSRRYLHMTYQVPAQSPLPIRGGGLGYLLKKAFSKAENHRTCSYGSCTT